MESEPSASRPPLVRRVAIAASVAAAVGLGAWLIGNHRTPAHPPLPAAAPPPPKPAPPPLKESQITVKSGDNVTGFFERAGLPEADTRALVKAFLSVRSARSIRPGNTFTVWQDTAGQIKKAAFQASDTDAIDFTPAADGFTARQREVKLVTQVVRISVDIKSSLYNAFLDAHEDPALAVAISDVLAWEVDFYRDVQPGDHLDVLVEKTTHDGKLVRYGDILGVRYSGKIGVKELYQWSHHGEVAYYHPNGESAKRPFLKQPLPFVHITSRFGWRLHPILGYFRAHKGVDYGAPVGTPVWAVGDGVVTWAGRKGQNGNLIAIRHSNGYTSYYAHLSRYGAGIHRGVRVRQKQIIGYVGATGLATGPHLHFAYSHGGQFVNPLNVKFPTGVPLARKDRPAFFAAISPLKTRLENPSLVASSASTVSSKQN